MSLNFITTEGSTPLDVETLEQLLPSHITTMGQLNELEQLNIAKASLWALSRSRQNVLTTEFAKSLHKRMFGDVWKWAGKFRTRAVNIGNADAHDIGVRLLQLFDDAQHWVEEKIYAPDVIAVRLHHALTLIHPFPNGNGRHARLMTDVLLINMGEPPFTWGSGADLVHSDDVRARYLDALRAADNSYDYEPLLTFARS